MQEALTPRWAVVSNERSELWQVFPPSPLGMYLVAHFPGGHYSMQYLVDADSDDYLKAACNSFFPALGRP